MFDLPKLYVFACSNSVQLVPLHPIIISILFYHYKGLLQCISDVEQIEGAASYEPRIFTMKEIGNVLRREHKHTVAFMDALLLIQLYSLSILVNFFLTRKATAELPTNVAVQ